jgi:hypothetical protein
MTYLAADSKESVPHYCPFRVHSQLAACPYAGAAVFFMTDDDSSDKEGEISAGVSVESGG